MLGHRWSPKLKDQECDNVLPGQAYHMPHGVVRDEHELRTRNEILPRGQERNISRQNKQYYGKPINILQITNQKVGTTE
jgi:hypothetical protein